MSIWTSRLFVTWLLSITNPQEPMFDLFRQTYSFWPIFYGYFWLRWLPIRMNQVTLGKQCFPVRFNWNAVVTFALTRTSWRVSKYVTILRFWYCADLFQEIIWLSTSVKMHYSFTYLSHYIKHYEHR